MLADYARNALDTNETPVGMSNNFRFGSFVWLVSLRNWRLVTFRLGPFGLELSPGIFRLRTFARVQESAARARWASLPRNWPLEPARAWLGARSSYSSLFGSCWGVRIELATRARSNAFRDRLVSLRWGSRSSLERSTDSLETGHSITELGSSDECSSRDHSLHHKPWRCFRCSKNLNYR